MEPGSKSAPGWHIAATVYLACLASTHHLQQVPLKLPLLVFLWNPATLAASNPSLAWPSRDSAVLFLGVRTQLFLRASPFLPVTPIPSRERLVSGGGPQVVLGHKPLALHAPSPSYCYGGQSPGTEPLPSPQGSLGPTFL